MSKPKGGRLHRSPLSDHFDDRLPEVEGDDARVEGRRECRNQGVVSTVAQPHPQEPPCVNRLVCQVEKVLVLADDDSVIGQSTCPKSTVVKQVKPALENVFCVMSAVVEPTGQGEEATGCRPETSCDLNDDMVRLLGGVGDGGEDVVPLETGIVRQDFLD